MANTFTQHTWTDGDVWNAAAVNDLEARIKVSGPFVNVADYGAVGDGVGGSRDTTAFQTAASVLQANQGGTLFIPSGQYSNQNYRIESTITLPKNTRVIGGGRYAARLKRVGFNGPILDFSGTSLSRNYDGYIEHLTLDSNAGTTGELINIDYTGRFAFNRMFFNGNGHEAINAVSAWDVYFTDCFWGISAPDASAALIADSGCNNWYFQHNRCEDFQGAFLKGTGLSIIKLNHCKIENHVWAGSYFDLTNCGKLILNGCHMVTEGATVSGYTDGTPIINIKGSMNAIHITDNDWSIETHAAQAPSIIGVGDGTGTVEAVWMDGNRFYGRTDYAPTYGVYFNGTVNRVSIGANYFQNFPASGFSEFGGSKPSAMLRADSPTLRYKTGQYYGPTGTLTTGTTAQGALRAVPFLVTEFMIVDRIGAEVTGAGEAGSVIRLGIYTDVGGVPTNLLLDAGTISGTAVQWSEITGLSTFLKPGVYWLAAVNQLCPTTAPTTRSFSSDMPGVGYTSTPTSGARVAYGGSTTTGALPSTFGTVSVQGTTTRVLVRST